MIRCGAFFFTSDKKLAAAAERNGKRIAVAGTRLRVSEVGAERGGTLVSLDYEGTGLPAIHGWQGSDKSAGEFTRLLRCESGVVAERDYCGTRPLYNGSSGSWLASDHRFLPGESRELVPRGTSLYPREREVSENEGERRGFEGSFDEAAAELATLVRRSVKARVEGKRRVAVAFSGGLDSSLVALCAGLDSKVVACSVAADGSADGRTARDAASVLGLEFARVRADAKRLGSELLDLDLPFQPSPMDKSLWCIYSMTAKLAAESGAELVMLGQLADELFGGYAKYEGAMRLGGEAEAARAMSRDVALCAERGFIRDEAACRRWCEPRFPFAGREIAIFGERLPVSFKIRDGVRKAVLREAALALGLPAELASRPKRAAQYSSGVMKLLT